MNRTDFLNMIVHEVPVSRQMIGEVYELIDIFPYFQSAHMLLLKSLYDNADVKFKNQLKNSAIHVCDREVLYWLLRTKSFSNPENTDIKKEDNLKTEIISDTHQTVIESAKNSEFLISEIEKNSDESRSLEKNDEPDRTIGHSVMVATEPDNTESSGVTFLLEEDLSPHEDKVFFMDPGFSVPDRSDLLELDLDLDEKSNEVSPGNNANLEHNVSEREKTKKQVQSDLIDRFIIDNPRIEPHKDKSNTALDDISKPFVEEAGGLVTETLARIYVNQGYYSKAIDIYEKLSLKFPEKSSYFASQIEKVKEYIKK